LVEKLLEYNINFIFRLFKWAYKISFLKRITFFSSGKIEIHDDLKLSIKGGSDGYIFIKNGLLDKNGKLLFEFREVGKFYASGAEKLKSCYGFPERTLDVLMIDDTKIEHLDVNYVGNSIHFHGVKLKTLKVKETDEKLSLLGDISELETLAYVPTNSYPYLCEPFKKFSESGGISSNAEAFRKMEKNAILIEFFFISTKNDYSKLRISSKADPNHYFSRLYNCLLDENMVFSPSKVDSRDIDLINWPENFFNSNMKKSTNNVIKFNL